MNATIDLFGYLAAEVREIWWQVEADLLTGLHADPTVLLYGGGVGGAAAVVAMGYLLYRKCTKGPDFSEQTDLAKIHYYAGCPPDPDATNACIELLAKNGHLVNVPLWKHCTVSHGYTPFLRACWNNNFELIQYMINIGADISLSNSDGETAMYLVAYRVSKSSSWDPRALNLLWEKGCSVDDVNVHNNSMLHLAAKAGNATLTRWLLLHGADPDIRNAYGFTPHALALRKGSPAHLTVANTLRIPVTNSVSPCPRFAIEEGGVQMTLFRSVSSPVNGQSDDSVIN
ncbi:histone-lysine N-methyltransferase EHMT1-like [Thrips palmi]|uniref:Histone-lysine N-methyltransferase EHMT1-like n=1 Tax=Thrips palmi TaxID=161013 RepID=A0A6P8ZNI7_THRPL|nr:histone-lysine N-methyltransferase EHMT1-like [Thrips palmi]